MNDTLKKGIEEFSKRNFLVAEKIFINLIRNNPLFFPAYSSLIQTFISQDKLEEALKYSEKLHKLDKNNERGLFFIGIIKFKKKKYNEALINFSNALTINPKNHMVLMNIGITYYRLGENKIAIKNIRESVLLNDKNEAAYYNLGVIYEDEDDLDMAMEAYNKVISLNPKHHDALHGVAQIQLTRLDYINGFKNYEVRWYIKGFEYRHRLINRLSSINNISGKKILVWCEQGFGDTIQFSRYINKLVDAGAKVTFEVQSPLLTFFKRQFSCNVTNNAGGEEFDFQCPTMSLPYVFGTDNKNIPQIQKYFDCDIEKYNFWKSRLSLSNNKLNLGISISGNRNHIKDKRRRVNLDNFLNLIDFCNIYIIQKDLYENDKEFLKKNTNIKYLGNDKEWIDFEDTSAIVKNMDAIVSVDTSLIHLSASMNQTTYLLLSKPADWRWSKEGFELPVWYKNLRIIRQKDKGLWENVINKLNLEIKQMIN